jgi:hypothetical protein
MKKSILLLSLCAAGLIQPALAQYPDVPKKVQEQAAALMKAAQAHSDSAWAVALPIVENDEKHGKPFVPWASRPTDLPQSKLLAFPGAEGGGAYTFGGRGGKVYVVTSLNDRWPR